MDEADRGSELEAFFLALAIQYRHKKILRLVATGECHNCHEPLIQPEQRFCDADCRDDWEKRHQHA